MQAGSNEAPRRHLPVRPDWLALRDEAAIEPDLPIVDPHHHLWDHAGSRYLLGDFLNDIATGHDIRATVFIECGTMYRQDGDPLLQPLGEVEFANGVAAMSASGVYGPARVCAGIVGRADLSLGERVQKVLEAQLAASGRFRGIRNISAWHPDPDARGSLATPPPQLLLDCTFREGFARLAPLGLSFDAWMYHTQLGELSDLVQAFSETTVVLNHLGGPIGIGPYADKRDEVFAAWRAAMRELAQWPNVYIKLGGLGMRLFGFHFHEAELPPSSEDLAAAWRPYIDTCIQMFGPSRCMFESNFPVDKGTCSYSVLWNAFKRVTTGYSLAERSELLSGTAARAYRLENTRHD